MNEARNVIIKDVELHWIKVAEPVDSYNGDFKQWECQVQVPVKRKAELEVYGKVKDQPNKKVSINFRKKAEKADGSPAQKIRVVDTEKEPLDPKTIGNGSKGNVMLMLKDYEIKHPKTGKVTKSGTSAMLTAIQITDLIIYERKNSDSYVDFDDVTPNDEDVPAKNKAPAKGKKVTEEDDDIPF